MKIKIYIQEGIDFPCLLTKDDEYRKEYVKKMEIQLRNSLQLSPKDEVIYFVKWEYFGVYYRYENYAYN